MQLPAWYFGSLQKEWGVGLNSVMHFLWLPHWNGRKGMASFTHAQLNLWSFHDFSLENLPLCLLPVTFYLKNSQIRWPETTQCWHYVRSNIGREVTAALAITQGWTADPKWNQWDWSTFVTGPFWLLLCFRDFTLEISNLLPSSRAFLIRVRA